MKTIFMNIVLIPPLFFTYHFAKKLSINKKNTPSEIPPLKKFGIYILSCPTNK